MNWSVLAMIGVLSQVGLFEEMISLLEKNEPIPADNVRRTVARLRRTGGLLDRDQAERVWQLYEGLENELLKNTSGNKKTRKQTGDRAFSRLAIKKESAEATRALFLKELLEKMPAEHMKPARLAAQFPGAIRGDAVRVTEKIQFDTSTTRWQSTALYAPPGETVTVTVPEKATGLGLRIRVGSHTDPISRRDVWLRWPGMVFSFPLENTRSEVASPFGGLIYLEVPGDAEPGLRFPATLSGAVRAPRFVLGKTSIEEWKTRIRHEPGAWGELENDKMIVTLPGELLVSLDRPDRVLTFWEAVVAAQDELCSRPPRRYRERIVFDIQVAYGYLHAGYPIVGPVGVGKAFLDLESLKVSGNWGLFHELGHNHQRPVWTRPNYGEVTVNIFSVYCMEKVVGLELEEIDWFKRALPKVHEYYQKLDDGARPEPEGFGLLLGMFMHLRKEFGWDFYRKVFKIYEDMGAENWPRDDRGRKNLWVKITSRVARRDLSPFYEKWGYEIDKDVKADISQYNPWDPTRF